MFRFYHYYQFFLWPVFLTLLVEIFLSITTWDALIEQNVSLPYFSLHWFVRVILFLYLSYTLVYKHNGGKRDGFKAGAFVGFFIGIFYSLFIFIQFPTLGQFFILLALPLQTLLAGVILMGGVTFFLYHFKHEREKVV